MQLTLVSHYGEKPAVLGELCRELQRQLASNLRDGFEPYALAQIHGTVVGLEGQRTSAGILNANLRRHRGCERRMDFNGLIRALRDIDPFKVRVGGFESQREFGFTSNNAHPFARSFSIQGEIAVSMGWPWLNGRCSAALFQLRKFLENFGVLHKWHQREEDRDNDFFFVLGRVDRARISDETIVRAETLLRESLAALEPVEICVSAETLAFVAYDDPRLPLTTSRAWRAVDRQLTPESLAAIYD